MPARACQIGAGRMGYQQVPMIGEQGETIGLEMVRGIVGGGEQIAGIGIVAKGAKGAAHDARKFARN